MNVQPSTVSIRTRWRIWVPWTRPSRREKRFSWRRPREVDADPLNRKGSAELIARRTRAVVETAVDETLNRTSRALGPAPLCEDAEHAGRVADLTVYVRQSHAERDLEQLGLRAAGR